MSGHCLLFRRLSCVAQAVGGFVSAEGDLSGPLLNKVTETVYSINEFLL